MAFEVKSNPNNATILRQLLCRLSASYDKPPNNDNIHFVAYSYPQNISSELYKTQILKQNNFLHNITLILSVNIDPDVIYSELHYTLITSMSITGIEETYLTHSKGKWLIVTTKNEIRSST